ncbi:uncharacterized protein LOC129913923 isoform X2 [Episyrphus balteatus]|uniref:uncharacterized protein LOC129913923 isoform X2 n=1 Tax=Episyrphus balteatus TaxID=286459 RepID=UPI0024866E78|nr:uncharacterized protein LOC129913923 isoform X2 [Episyrphus balteatus]
MYSRKVDCEIFYDRRESIGSSKSSSFASDYGSSKDGSSSSSDHYNPTLRLLQIPRSSNGSMGFHLTRSKWDPYPWISAVDKNTPAKFHGLKAGDCVLEVNGEDILGMRISEIADLVNSETKTIDNVALLLWSPGSDNNCNPRNLCCGPMPLNLERLTAFTQTILAIIECPVCLETIAPPILQCQNGHILCVKCRILSHICPVCRQHFYPGRSLVAEQIYNSITDTFNLRSPDKLQGYSRDQLFGAKYKRSSSISISTSLSSASTVSIKDERRYQQRRRRSEKQQNNGDIRLKSTPPPPTPPLEVNKFESHQASTNKFLTKLLGRAYSMDNLSSSTRRHHRCRRQSAPLLSLTRITIGRIADDNVGVGSKDIDDYNIGDENVDVNGDTKANWNSSAADFNEQSEVTNLCRQSTFEPRRPTLISKQFSLSAHDLSKKDNDGLIAIQQQHERLSKNRLQYLWLERSSVQMTILPSVLPLLAGAVPPLLSSSELGPRKISLGSVQLLKDGRPLELEPATVQISCCIAEQVVFFCPFSCGKQFSGPALHQHIKVDHSAPILCYNSSSAELALPLRAPLDKAAVLLMCDGKDFWIKLRTHGEKNITAFAVFQGPEDESSDFMMETRLRNQIDKDQEVDEDDDDNQCYHPKANANDDDYVKIVVNNDNGILERELITRSIVRSMNVATWEYTSYFDVDDGSSRSTDKNEKFRDILYNQKDIQSTFGEAIDYRNLLLKIIIKKR